jgi:hypothetical protein
MFVNSLMSPKFSAGTEKKKLYHVNPATGPKAIGPGHHVLKSPKL